MRVPSPVLSARHERCIHVALATVFATGIAWLILHYGVNRSAGLEDGWRIAESWSLKLHGAAAMAMLVALGSLIAAHVPEAWARKLNRRSGIAMLSAVGLLVATGWLLYYTSGELTRAWASAAHIAAGLAGPLILLWHLAHRRASGRTPGAFRSSNQ